MILISIVLIILGVFTVFYRTSILGVLLGIQVIGMGLSALFAFQGHEHGMSTLLIVLLSIFAVTGHALATRVYFLKKTVDVSILKAKQGGQDV